MNANSLHRALSAICLLGHVAAVSAAETPRTGGSFTVGVETEPNTFNPQLNGQAKADVTLRNVWESLLARQPDGSFVPWLAQRYQASADGSQYRFTLRRDVLFSNGEKLDAQAVAENFRHTQDARYCAGTSLCMMGARINSIETPDDFTVVINLKQGYTPFLSFAAALEILAPASWQSTQHKSGGKEHLR